MRVPPNPASKHGATSEIARMIGQFGLVRCRTNVPGEEET